MDAINTADPDDLDSIVKLIVDQQGRTERQIAYLSETADAIAEELEGMGDLATQAWVMRAGSVIEGFIMGETDPDLDRVWWIGPYVSGDDWDGRADALYLRARSVFGQNFQQEELAADPRHTELARFAARHGFMVEEASVLLRCDRRPPPLGGVAEMAETDRSAVALLHDIIFPGTHTTGAGLVASVDERHIRLVASAGGAVAGYAAVELQADGSGYLDFIGVAPAHRRLGMGRALVAGATRWLFDLGATHVHLTVREGNTAARALYASLGFEEVQMLAPYRKGFTLG